MRASNIPARLQARQLANWFGRRRRWLSGEPREEREMGGRKTRKLWPTRFRYL